MQKDIYAKIVENGENTRTVNHHSSCTLSAKSSAGANTNTLKHGKDSRTQALNTHSLALSPPSQVPVRSSTATTQEHSTFACSEHSLILHSLRQVQGGVPINVLDPPIAPLLQ